MTFQDRLSQLPQTAPGKRVLVKDLSPDIQLRGINQILSGVNSTNPQLNDFVRNSARRGMTPEQIRQEFIKQQSISPTPLIIIQ